MSVKEEDSEDSHSVEEESVRMILQRDTKSPSRSILVRSSSVLPTVSRRGSVPNGLSDDPSRAVSLPIGAPPGTSRLSVSDHIVPVQPRPLSSSADVQARAPRRVVTRSLSRSSLSSTCHGPMDLGVHSKSRSIFIPTHTMCLGRLGSRGTIARSEVMRSMT